MPLLDVVANSLILMNELGSSPIVLIFVAIAAGYFGWRVVEFIPFTRRIIERRDQR
ncbi:hypothetical protein ACQP1K_05145 [Sphaerimonospora sp. CA-214678]|uniref:hypothetical protein n=1 Tax=Sphaerimonospora sp. CA-214678 TaxID=3240029 RepID=UPI003D9491F7